LLRCASQSEAIRAGGEIEGLVKVGGVMEGLIREGGVISQLRKGLETQFLHSGLSLMALYQNPEF